MPNPLRGKLLNSPLLEGSGTGALLPSTNLLAWWDANFGVYEDTGLTDAAEADDAVAGWADRGPSGYHVTQSSATVKPAYRASVAGLNNKPALQFDGGDLLSRTVAAGIVANLTTYTIYAVVLSSTAAQMYYYSEGNTGSFHQYHGLRVNGAALSPVHTADDDTSANPTGTGDPNDGSAHLLTFRRIASNSWAARLDGAEVGTDNDAPGTTTMNTITIGALIYIATQGYVTGHIAQVAIYSSDNYTTIEPLLMTFYGIT